MSHQLTRREPTNLTGFGYDQQAINLIKDLIAKEASDPELALFLMQCQRSQLDPFAKQIYCIGRWDTALGRKVFTTQISIDGARLTAERSNKYEGQDGPYWCGPDGVWKDIWLESYPPSAARVGVMKKGFKQVLYAVANWESYCQKGKGKDGKEYIMSMWAKFPSLMLGKVAEMLALRRAFPMELSGLTGIEEAEAEAIDAESVPETKVEDVLPMLVETPPTPEIFTNNEANTAMFFATAEKLGIPNTEANTEFLRKVYKKCLKQPMNTVADMMLDAINEVGNTKN